jgi:hypothetical protein
MAITIASITVTGSTTITGQVIITGLMTATGTHAVSMKRIIIILFLPVAVMAIPPVVKTGFGEETITTTVAAEIIIPIIPVVFLSHVPMKSRAEHMSAVIIVSRARVAIMKAGPAGC